MSNLEKIHQTLIKKKKTLALAESCTGGHLAAMFSAMPDASKYLLGSIVAYSNEMKEKILKVSHRTIALEGAVSRSTADEMWIGLMKISDADFGVATTGIAGPTGGTKEKPVGTVFLALGERGKKPHVIECHFEGERRSIIQKACDRVIEEFSFLL